VVGLVCGGCTQRGASRDSLLYQILLVEFGVASLEVEISCGNLDWFGKITIARASSTTATTVTRNESTRSRLARMSRSVVRAHITNTLCQVVDAGVNRSIS